MFAMIRCVHRARQVACHFRDEIYMHPTPISDLCWQGGMLLVLLLVSVPSPPARAENWTRWRGSDGNGLSPLAAAETWTAEQNIGWRVKLPGSGISSPIVWENRVFITAAEGPRQSELHVQCLALDGGRTLWHRRLWGTSPTLFHATKGGMASPTPVTDGNCVYAFYGTGDVFCLDVEGDLRWHRSLASEYGSFENRFGHTSSPLLWNDLLILQCDHYGESYLLAIDKITGLNRWKTDRPGAWHSWSSPCLMSTATGTELVVCSSEAVDAFDPQTGDKHWTVQGMQRECIPTPVSGHGLLYAVSGPKGKTFAIRPGGRGDVTASHVAWSSTRGGPFVPSPILVGDYFYSVHDQGIVTCLDAHSGRLVWQKRLAGEFTASPVAAAQRIYFFNDRGETFVIRANTSQFEQLARNVLDEPIYATPALANGQLLIRTPEHLIGVKAP